MVEGPVGEVWADVRFRGEKAPADVEKVLTKAEKDGDAKMAQIGDEWGHTLDKHIQKETRNTGRDLATSISHGIENEGLKIGKMVVEIGPNGQVGRRWITAVAHDVERAVEQDVAAGASGVLNKAGRTVADAVGAGFNVSGKSPLIALLIPVFGAIVEVILAAVQAASALVAVLTLVPSLLFAIGLQAGALFLVFHNLLTVIPQAFAAKDAKEFEDAIKGLSPAAQDFVRSLLPLRDFFKQLTDLTQNSFFKAFGDALTHFVTQVGQPWLTVELPMIAEHLGTLFRTILSFFSSPQFVAFLNGIVPQITRFLDVLGPQLYEFLFGITTFANALRPFLQWFGDSFATAIGDIGFWLNNLAHDQGFLNWLDRMEKSWSKAGDVLGEALKLIVAIAESIDKTGVGDNLLKELADALSVLAGFFASDLGQKAIEGIASVAIGLTKVFVALVIIVGSFFALIQMVWDFILHGIPELLSGFPGAIGDFFTFIGKNILDFFTFVGQKIMDFLNNLGPNITNFINGIVDFIIGIFPAIGQKSQETFNAIGDNIRGAFADAANTIAFFVTDVVPNFFSSLPARIWNAIGDLSGLLYQKGRDLAQGLINGLLNMLGPIGAAASFVAGTIKDHLPSSPAKKGPLSGSGDPMKAGQRISQRIAAGIEIGAPEIAAASSVATSNVLLGAGAVQMNFYGPTPTTQQASAVGTAAGNSLANTLSMRDTRLAVRTLGAA